jgi:hypothetical protein
MALGDGHDGDLLGRAPGPCDALAHDRQPGGDVGGS